MSGINKVTFNTPYTNDLKLYTKRTCSDNSEMYIKSKLNMLYKQALSNKIQFASKRNLRKLVEGNHLDETV